MLDNPSGRWAILKGNIGIMLLSSGLWNLAGAMTWPFYSLYVLELGGSHVDIGFISALGAIARILPTLFGGYLADALGRKKILYTMSFILATNELIRAFAPSYTFLYVAVVVESLAGGFRGPAFMSILADSTTADNRALSYSLWQVVPPLFGLFSPYLIGLVIDSRGVLLAMRWAYIFTFAMGLIASFLRYRYIEETLTIRREVNGDPGSAVREIIAEFKETISSLPMQLWIFLAIDFVFTFAWALSEPYFVTYANEEASLTASQWGLISMLVTVTRTIITPPAALASDRYGRLKFILPCMFLWPAGFYLFGNSRGFQAILLARLLIAVSGSIGSPAWDALFTDYAPKEHRGRFSAIADIFWSLIWGAGNIAGGAIYQGYSKSVIFEMGAALLIIGALAAWLKMSEPKEREE
ncbi:MAG: MFS transporter [Candidatus Bathyarchaeota archaeon]|jgi:MFS family permease